MDRYVVAMGCLKAFTDDDFSYILKRLKQGGLIHEEKDTIWLIDGCGERVERVTHHRLIEFPFGLYRNLLKIFKEFNRVGYGYLIWAQPKENCTPAGIIRLNEEVIEESVPNLDPYWYYFGLIEVVNPPTDGDQIKQENYYDWQGLLIQQFIRQNYEHIHRNFSKEHLLNS